MKPTRLYIKQHSKTGLRYFGKTGTKLIESYVGSGVYWKNHINKHGLDHVNTIWVSDWFTSEEEIKDFAIAFSELFDIVNSNEWANMKIENGLDGGGPGPMLFGDDNPSRRPEVAAKISKSLMGHLGVKNKGSTGMAPPNKNKLLWNNGIDTIYSDECPGDGWIRGDLAINKVNKHLAKRKRGKEHHNYGKKRSAEEIKSTSAKCTKYYIVTFPDSDIKTIRGLNDFCASVGIKPSGAHRVMNGYQTSYKGYIFKRVQK